MFDVATYGGNDRPNLIQPSQPQKGSSEKQQEQRNSKVDSKAANGTSQGHEKKNNLKRESDANEDKINTKRPRTSENERSHRRQDDGKDGKKESTRNPGKNQRSPEVKRVEKQEGVTRNSNAGGVDEDGAIKRSKDRDGNQNIDNDSGRQGNSKGNSATKVVEDGRTGSMYQDGKKGSRSRERHDEQDGKVGKTAVEEPDRKKHRRDQSKEPVRESQMSGGHVAPGFVDDNRMKGERGGGSGSARGTTQDRGGGSGGRSNYNQVRRR
eukprot:TRINITY_DN8352_c1_g2_i3.p1 TRINITY_DN8352_c1_g2~~TRINITY_DN8352_c1_g2_i3.p1  ORF type:complete len:291 (+),score=55.09 TRINITY_DN8352_c1_g2_i3:73-873(+)